MILYYFFNASPVVIYNFKYTLFRMITLNDLQILSKMESPEVMKEIGDRNKEQSVFVALKYGKQYECDERQ